MGSSPSKPIRMVHGPQRDVQEEGAVKLNDKTDAPPARGETPKSASNALELATPVSAKVQIQGVVLTGSTVKRGPEVTIEQGHYRVYLRVPGVSYRVDLEHQRLSIIPTFS